MPTQDNATPAGEAGTQDQHELNLSGIIQEAIQRAYAQRDPETSGLRNELAQERRKREQMEKRLNELVEENRRAKELAEQAERFSTVKSELQRLGVTKVELAFRAVKDDIFRGEDGRICAKNDEGQAVPFSEYLSQWVTANPEFRPARIAGGSGSSASRGAQAGSSFDLEKIRPGMTAEELERARSEVARVASQMLGNHIG